MLKPEVTQRPLSPTHQNNPQTPQVAGLVVAVVFEDLWRGVLQREAGSLQELIVGRLEAGEAKVYDFDLGVLALVREEQVLAGDTRRQSFLNWTSGLGLTRYSEPVLGSNNFALVAAKIAE